MDSIPARCRDENGYLVRQSLMTDVPYGRRTVARAGCGFLAVYNAARFFGLPVRESEVWAYFHRGVFLGAVMGTTIGHLVPGRVPLRHEDHRGALPRPEKRPGGILWYHTGHSRHYVLVRRCEDGRYAFPNSSAPEPLAFPEFYGKYVKHLRLPPLRIDLPIMFTLTLDRRNKTGPAGQH